jgi:hypothetical protein
MLRRNWNDFYSEVTTKNMLDWSISSLILTISIAIAFLFIASVAFGVLEVFLRKAEEVRVRIMEPFIDDLRRRFGPLSALLILLALAIAAALLLLITVGFLLALFDFATW